MDRDISAAALGALVLTLLRLSCRAETEEPKLEPPEFNLASGKNITATATCGVGEDNTVFVEDYCFIGGVHDESDRSVYINYGQICSECNKSDPMKWHPASNAIDGNNTWWMSPPLSRGMQYNKVNLTIDLGREYQVAYVAIKMGNSPRPGVWALEKSMDYGKTYEPWQYFADKDSNCMKYFGVSRSDYPTADDSVLCVTDFSNAVPLSNGEIFVSLLKGRPSAKNFTYSSTLQKWTRATNVRLHLIHTKTLLGHLMSLIEGEPTVTRRYFYSIKDISIGGKCNCNGHAEECGEINLNDRHRLWCNCTHNTDGINCERCKDGFVQKSWRAYKIDEPFICEPCNCFGHSDKCEYNATIDHSKLSLDINGKYEGGGVCKHCKHNTDGINCNKCKPGFYRPYGRPLNATNVCEKCRCNKKHSSGNCKDGDGMCECRPEYKPPYCQSCSHGHYGFPFCHPCECVSDRTEGDHCRAEGGECICKKNFAGKLCEKCADGYYNFPACLPCSCNLKGAVNNTCDPETGDCKCKKLYKGKNCEKCMDGYYKFPKCYECSCNKEGTTDEICDMKTGSCLCKKEHDGKKCEQCKEGRYSFPKCKSCDCSSHGSSSISCSNSGKCSCHHNYMGTKCNECKAGYYQYPDCLDCKCDSNGSLSKSCDDDGKCTCRANFTGVNCNKCRQGHFNFPVCEACNCDPRGVKDSEADCELQPTGEMCSCKKNVFGHICEICKPGFWNIQKSNPDGCEDCKCHLPGVIGGISECNSLTGQCQCKPNVNSLKCEECENGTFNLQNENIYGCSDCGCDVGGSLNDICDKRSGQCSCRPHIEGRTCSKPVDGFYFPTLYQLKYEAEDARQYHQPTVYFHYDENLFPNSSGRGYAVFSEAQKEIFLDINVKKPSNYHMILHYVNLNHKQKTFTVEIIPAKGVGSTEMYKAEVKPTKTPSFVVVTGFGTLDPSIILDPGNLTIKIISEIGILLDYIVLVPSEYFEASILTKKVNIPCHQSMNSKENYTLCMHMEYLNISSFDKTVDKKKKMEKDPSVLDLLILKSKVGKEKESKLQISISASGKYVLLVIYLNPKEDGNISQLGIESTSPAGMDGGYVDIYPCNFTVPCHQVVKDSQGSIKIFTFQKSTAKLKFEGDDKDNIEIKKVAAIPYDQWSYDYIKPKSVCVKLDGECMPNMFPIARNSKRFEFESSSNYKRTYNLPQNLYKKNIGLIYMDKRDDVIHMKGEISAKRSYVILAHYYQPHYSSFQFEVMIHNGRIHQAYLDIHYCPSAFGCRSLVKEPNGNIFFKITNKFRIELKKNESKAVWLDYLLIIPKESYENKVLEEENIDLTALFIHECGKNNFYIEIDSQGFCRNSIFSITSHYNNGALPCDCDSEGSLSPTCKKFGGQCSCKERIIGRRCDRCKTGYFGFPDCFPCKCPYKLPCNSTTGTCLCPPKVTGEECDQCEEYSYDFNDFYGCKVCSCNPEGVENGNLNCNKTTGYCSCRKNVEGKTCNHCSAGYSSFPTCKTCACDLRGTIQGICDEVSGECLCKENVIGNKCERCKEGTFNIDVKNINGCTSCYCSGKTKDCISSKWYRSQVLQIHGWKLEEVIIREKMSKYELYVRNTSVVPSELDGVIHADLTTKEIAKKTVYFAAPENYLGNKLSSYGGFLNYTITYSHKGSSESVVKEANVIFYGSDTLIYPVDKFLEREKINHISIKLTEGNFKLLNGAIATRKNILEVIKDLKGLFIQATYSLPPNFTKLSKVIMETAEDAHVFGASQAIEVEQCSCPSNYKGLSCEDCASGYFRSKNGDCIPCQCSNHADECDQLTGACVGCKHNTIGDHCDQCKKGYFGNATSGKSNACVRCACPLKIESNNFAEECRLQSDGKSVKCDCIGPYQGDQCEICAPGYYGKPKSIGNKCQPCQCSGNINPYNPGSCDHLTGKCLECLNNTSGDNCSKCAEGYYGDAVIKKNCERCKCNACGTSSCDGKTGECKCKNNVNGDTCNQCTQYYWNFDSCKGCTPCNCQTASKSMQCDVKTGQCVCQTGVTGFKCDKCEFGYWNYTSEGCSDCGCNKKFSIDSNCDPYSGECICKSGLIGRTCDHCPRRYVLVDGHGCQECSICIHILLNETDHLSEMTNNIKWELNVYERKKMANKLLSNINDSVTTLQVQLKFLKYDILPLENETVALGDEANKAHQRLASCIEASVKLNQDGMNFLLWVLSRKREVHELIEFTRTTVDEIVTYNDDIIYGSSIEDSFQEAVNLFNKIKAINFTSKKMDIHEGLKKAQKWKEWAQEWSYLQNGSILITNIYERIDKIEKKSIDLEYHAKISNEKLTEANLIELKNRFNQTFKDIEDIQVNKKIIKTALTEATGYLGNATEIHPIIKSLNKSMISDLAKMNKLIEKVKYLIESRKDQLEVEQGLTKNAVAHAEELHEFAEDISEHFVYTRNSSVDAMNAANAYKNIIDAVNFAKNAAKDADKAAMALEMPQDILEQIQNSNERSLKALFDARHNLHNVQINLKPNLTNINKDMETTRGLFKLYENGLREINSTILEINHEKVKKQLKDAHWSAENSIQMSKDTLMVMSNINTTKSLVEVHYVSKTFHDARVNISQANIQVEKSKSILPRLIKVGDVIERMQLRHKMHIKKIKNEMMKLKNSISNAINEINRISVGVKFSNNSIIMLRNPKGLAEIGTSGNISMHFTTKKKNGLLFYLGNEEGTKYRLRRLSSDDFLAIEIENGHPILKINLGSGIETITSEKYVADGSWYQILINRTGKIVQLIVCEKNKGRKICHQKKKILKGSYSVLDLDQNFSKIFVGGYPESFAMQPEIIHLSFEGGVEELSIGNYPVSLWNFEEAYNISGLHQSYFKDEADEEEQEKVMKFDGTGYMTFKGNPNQIKNQFTIIFYFKTTANDGLLFLVKNGHSFLSIELTEGSILYQFDLGNGMAVLNSGSTYNDGKWHSVEAGRQGNRAILKVDSEEKAYGSSPGNSTFLITTEIMYFGGFPLEHNFKHVSNKAFIGCIKDVEIESKTLPWSSYLTANGVFFGCSEKVENVASFQENSRDFIRLSNVTAMNHLQLTFKFNTTQENGLLFYITDSGQWNTLSLSMVNGSLVMCSSKIQIPSSRVKQRRYNDGKWHSVTAILDKNVMILHIDDYNKYNPKNVSVNFEIENGNIYFGGVPEGYYIKNNNAVHQEPFIGCIGDPTFNDNVIKFQEIGAKSSAVIGKCNTKKNSDDQYTLDEYHTLEFHQGKYSFHTKSDCSLPLVPIKDEIHSNTISYRYGMQPLSYTEYSIDTIRIKHNVSIDFKTDKDDGVIFYTASDRHLLALYMKDGKLNYMFNCNNEIKLLSTREFLSDGNWHSAAFTRHSSRAKLFVDNYLVAEIPTSCKTLKISDSFSIGGISRKYEPNSHRNRNIPNSSFYGCIRNIQFSGHIMDQPSEQKGIFPCTDGDANRAFFTVDAGYMIIAEKFNVGNTTKIEMSIKPRKLEGLLLSIHGKKDFLIIEMNRGKIIFTVGFGRRTISTEYVPSVNNSLCDGNWHNITASKVKNILILTVDSHQSMKRSDEGSTYIQTSNPLYLGGHADISSSLKGVRTQESFVGCIADVSIKSKPIDFTNKKFVGKILVGVCPSL